MRGEGFFMMQWARIHEGTKETPVVGVYDVIVCGGGPAGVAAALAAVRGGAKTCIIEQHGCLGGIWTAGLLSYILDGQNKTGLLPEMLTELDKTEARQGYVCDPEEVKLVLESMCMQAGVDSRLYTRIAAAHQTDGKLTHMITESKSGREAWGASVFIDATGDGDAAAMAGCGFSLGHPDTGEMQPMSLIALVAGPNPDEVTSYTKIEKQSRINLLAEIERGGFTPSYHSPALWHIRDDLYILMANHEYRVSAINAGDMTRATLQARKELHRIIEALRRCGGIWSSLRLVATGGQIGVREGRRIEGRYKVTIEDIVGGVIHEDGICRVTFKIDVHAMNPERTKGFETYNADYRAKALPYDIPLRALIAKDVDGLLLAGRCISGDFLAHSSYRVTGNAVQMGEAAGKLAAYAVHTNKQPHKVSWNELVGASIFQPAATRI